MCYDVTEFKIRTIHNRTIQQNYFLNLETHALITNDANVLRLSNDKNGIEN